MNVRILDATKVRSLHWENKSILRISQTLLTASLETVVAMFGQKSRSLLVFKLADDSLLAGAATLPVT